MKLEVLGWILNFIFRLAKLCDFLKSLSVNQLQTFLREEQELECLLSKSDSFWLGFGGKFEI